MKNSFLLKEAKNITKQKKRTKNARSAHTGQDHFKLLFSHHFISLSTMVVGFFCSANRINLFHYKEVMAVSAELLDDLVGMADDFAAHLM